MKFLGAELMFEDTGGSKSSAKNWFLEPVQASRTGLRSLLSAASLTAPHVGVVTVNTQPGRFQLSGRGAPLVENTLEPLRGPVSLTIPSNPAAVEDFKVDPPRLGPGGYTARSPRYRLTPSNAYRNSTTEEDNRRRQSHSGGRTPSSSRRPKHSTHQEPVRSPRTRTSPDPRGSDTQAARNGGAPGPVTHKARDGSAADSRSPQHRDGARHGTSRSLHSESREPQTNRDEPEEHEPLRDKGSPSNSNGAAARNSGGSTPHAGTGVAEDGGQGPGTGGKESGVQQDNSRLEDQKEQRNGSAEPLRQGAATSEPSKSPSSAQGGPSTGYSSEAEESAQQQDKTESSHAQASADAASQGHAASVATVDLFDTDVAAPAVDTTLSDRSWAVPRPRNSPKSKFTSTSAYSPSSPVFNTVAVLPQPGQHHSPRRSRSGADSPSDFLSDEGLLVEEIMFRSQDGYQDAPAAQAAPWARSHATGGNPQRSLTFQGASSGAWPFTTPAASKGGREAYAGSAYSSASYGLPFTPIRSSRAQSRMPHASRPQFPHGASSMGPPQRQLRPPSPDGFDAQFTYPTERYAASPVSGSSIGLAPYHLDSHGPGAMAAYGDQGGRQATFQGRIPAHPMTPPAFNDFKQRHSPRDIPGAGSPRSGTYTPQPLHRAPAPVDHAASAASRGSRPGANLSFYQHKGIPGKTRRMSESSVSITYPAQCIPSDHIIVLLALCFPWILVSFSRIATGAQVYQRKSPVYQQM